MDIQYLCSRSDAHYLYTMSDNRTHVYSLDNGGQMVVIMDYYSGKPKAVFVWDSDRTCVIGKQNCIPNNIDYQSLLGKNLIEICLMFPKPKSWVGSGAKIDGYYTEDGYRVDISYFTGTKVVSVTVRDFINHRTVENYTLYDTIAEE